MHWIVLIESEDATKHLRHGLTLRSALLAVVLIGGAAAFAANMEDAFLEENDAAMTKMMVDMLAEPTGDVDTDFVAAMIAHHQGAIDMARAQLRYGTSAQVRHVAQAIIVREEKEIAALRRAADAAGPASESAQ